MVTRTSESKVDYFDQVQGFGPLPNLELSDPTQAETSSSDHHHTYPVKAYLPVHRTEPGTKITMVIRQLVHRRGTKPLDLVEVVDFRLGSTCNFRGGHSRGSLTDLDLESILHFPKV